MHCDAPMTLKMHISASAYQAAEKESGVDHVLLLFLKPRPYSPF